MILAMDKPDLRRIGEMAFPEVLSHLLSLSAATIRPPDHPGVGEAPGSITSSVPLHGERVCGHVRIQLSQAFAVRVVRRLTGVEGLGEASTMSESHLGTMNHDCGHLAGEAAGAPSPGSWGETIAAQNDAAGEIANMVAGRVAARLGAEGYPCRLGTPTVCRHPPAPDESPPGTDRARVDFVCEGHRLSMELECRYGLV